MAYKGDPLGFRACCISTKFGLKGTEMKPNERGFQTSKILQQKRADTVYSGTNIY